jgi:hypothetical protein
MKKILLASAALAGVLLSSSAHADDAWCNRPTVFLGDTYDPDPVTNVRVQYNPDYHTWNILMYSGGGRVVSRAQQYAITDYTNDFQMKWGGSLNRNRNLYMVGELRENGVYEEWLYDRSHGNRLDMHWAVRCKVDVPYPNGEPPRRPGQQVSPDWDPRATILVAPPAAVNAPRAAPAPVVVAPPAAQAAPPAPAPVVVAPVIVIPGVTGVGQYPAPPAERPALKADGS